MTSPEKAGPILAVDDDPRILRLVRSVLEDEGYRVMTAESGQDAIRAVRDGRIALVLLDIAMPLMDGLTACRRIREFSLVPIIVLTGKGNPDDKVRGFDAGADDYVTKPFFPAELLARIRAVLRRAAASGHTGEAVITNGDLTVDMAANRVLVAGKEVVLTGTEYRLLSYLASNAGRVVTPEQILTRVWGDEYREEVHLLRVTMARLRLKLGDDGREPRYIQTRQGIGYSLIKQAA